MTIVTTRPTVHPDRGLVLTAVDIILLIAVYAAPFEVAIVAMAEASVIDTADDKGRGLLCLISRAGRLLLRRPTDLIEG